MVSSNIVGSRGELHVVISLSSLQPARGIAETRIVNSRGPRAAHARTRRPVGYEMAWRAGASRCVTEETFVYSTSARPCGLAKVRKEATLMIRRREESQPHPSALHKARGR